jgi:hypothetical protein
VALHDGSLPDAADALAAGKVSFEHVAALAAAKDDLPDGAAVNLLAQATVMAPDKFANTVRKASRPAERVAEAFTGETARGRWLRFDYDVYDGSVAINTLHKVMDEQWRDEHPDREAVRADRPPYSQRLAQAFLEMCRRINNATRNTNTAPSDRGGTDDEGVGAKNPAGWTTPTPEAFLVISDATLRADAESVGIATTIDGTPIPAGVLRKLLVDAKIYPVVVGGDGEILDFGRGRRLFSAAQKKAMAVRDGTCQFADCDRPATTATDAHHYHPWHAGGLTNLTNGGPVCDPCHAKLTKDGYRLERRNGVTHTYAPDGTLIHTRTNRWRK